MPRFKPGQTGNPTGRGGKHVDDAALAAMARSRSKAILKNLLAIAEGRSPRHITSDNG